MARFQCDCGEVLWNGMAPNDIQLKVYTDREWDCFTNVEYISPFDIPPPKYDVWRCPKCKRIYVFGDEGEVILKYVLEKGTKLSASKNSSG